MNNIENFGERLGEIMFEKSVTVEKLSKDVCIDLSGIYRYLRKQSLPTVENTIKIADYFNCSVDFLLGLTEENITEQLKSEKNFCDILKEILIKRNCSRYMVRKNTRIADQSLNDWYHGIKTPKIENYIVLAKYFDCSVDYLLGRAKYV